MVRVRERIIREIRQRMKELAGGPREDILLIMEGTEASKAIVNALAEPLINEDIRSVEVRSEEGRDILEELPGDVSVPTHVVDANGSYRVGDLSSLIQRYVGAGNER